MLAFIEMAMRELERKTDDGLSVIRFPFKFTQRHFNKSYKFSVEKAYDVDLRNH